MRLVWSLLIFSCIAALAKDYRGAQFLGFTQFEKFERTNTADAAVFTSPKIEAAIDWNELVASWNFRGDAQLGLEVEARAIHSGGETKWYRLGKWSLEPKRFPRESVPAQRDDDGAVATDVLKLQRKARALQLRVTLRGVNELAPIKFLGVAICDREIVGEAGTDLSADGDLRSSSRRNDGPRNSLRRDEFHESPRGDELRESLPSLPPNKEAWSRSLDVPRQSQMAFENGGEWCSPTAVTMMLSYWAEKLSRPELRHDVPEAAQAVNDPNWPGTGNWSFNMAFAGSHDGIRAYVARMSDVSELEDWIAAGVPVAVSVRYGILKGAENPGNGHLVVCVGFDQEGNIIVNDPGRTQVRQTYSRENLVKAWARSENTVYLIYPEDWKVPEDRFGHWTRF